MRTSRSAQLADFIGGGGVESPGGFVGQQRLGMGGVASGKADALWTSASSAVVTAEKPGT